MFEGQPKGLYALALANTGERFGYYTMLAVFTLFLQENFGWTEAEATSVYSVFMGFVYFLPFIGGILADKFGFGRMVTTGIFIMFFGYLFLSLPLGNGTTAMAAMFAALLLVCVGTGLFKGNLQVMVGNLYDTPELQGKRDSAFSIFYMAINIGALFAPTAAVKIMDYAQMSWGYTKADSYHFAFAVACASLIFSILIYYAFRSSFRTAESGARPATAKEAVQAEELTPQETRERIIALCFVFAVVVFFWMAFHQNGATLTYFARDYVETSSTGVQSMLFNVWNLVLGIVAIYGVFGVFQSKTGKGKIVATVVLLAALAGLYYKYTVLEGSVAVEAPIFQHFNPCFVVGLTPVSIALFGWLARKGKELSAPRKIGLGMLVAAAGYVVMMIASDGLATPDAQSAAIKAGVKVTRINPNWLISTYLVLTFGELLLSPMGISFVSKVAPPKYKGLMMGGWFVATAIGNLLISIPAFLWGGRPLMVVWGVLVALCVLSFVFIFSMMKKLEKVA